MKKQGVIRGGRASRAVGHSPFPSVSHSKLVGTRSSSSRC